MVVARLYAQVYLILSGFTLSVCLFGVLFVRVSTSGIFVRSSMYWPALEQCQYFSKRHLGMMSGSVAMLTHNALTSVTLSIGMVVGHHNSCSDIGYIEH